MRAEAKGYLQILVHGERTNMMRLKSKLLSLNNAKATKVKVYSPANCEELRIPFKVDKVAKVVGRLAEIPPPSTDDPDDKRLLSGVLVQNDFKLSLMAADDLREYAGLTTTTILCKQHITLSTAGSDLIKWALEGTFGAIDEIGDSSANQENGFQTEVNGNGVTNGDTKMEEHADEEIGASVTTTFLIMGCVTVRYHSRSREVELEWEGNTLNDGIADAVMAVLMTVESSPAAVKRTSPT